MKLKTHNLKLKVIMFFSSCVVKFRVFLSSVSSSVGLALVVCGELAFCHGEELGFDDLLAEW